MEKLKSFFKFWRSQNEPEISVNGAKGTKQKIPTYEPIWFNIEPPISLFTGREEELNWLLNIIQKNRGQKVLKIVVVGKSGVGKTQIVRKFIQIHAKDHYENLVWIHSENETEISNSFAELGTDYLKLTKIYLNEEKKAIEDILREVYEILKDRDSLIVFDNVESNAYEKFLAQLGSNNKKKLHALLTRREYGNEGSVINIQELPKPDAIRLIKKCLGIEDEDQDEDIEQLLEKLSRFPLCVMQAVAYIQQQVPGFKIKDYIRELGTIALDYKDYKETVNVVLGTSVTKVANDEEYGNTALRILNTVSYLACRNIRIELLSNIVENDSKLKGAVDLLVKYATVSSNNVMTLLNVHKLVQDITRKNVNEDEVDIIIETAFTALQRLYPITEEVKEVRLSEALPHYESLLGHIKIRLEKSPESQNMIKILTDLSSMLVTGYAHLGNSSRTKEILSQILSLHEKYYGPDNIEIAATLTRLSEALTDPNEVKKKIELLERALMIEEKYYGQNHLAVTETLFNLACAYGHLGQAKKKVELLEITLGIYEEQYGPEHHDIAAMLTYLSFAYEDLDQYEKQIESLERTLTIKEKHYGLDHDEVAQTLTSVGIAYGHLKNSEKEKEAYEKCLQILEKNYGPNHFAVGSVLTDLGNAYGNLGDVSKQKEVLERALTIINKHNSLEDVGVNAPNKVVKLEILSNIYKQLGEFQKAKDYLEKALYVKECHYGPNHLEVSTTLANLGLAYGKLSQFEKEREMLEKSLSIFEKHYGPNHYRLIAILTNLSLTYGKLGEFPKKKELLNRVLKLQENHYGPHYYFERAKTLILLADSESNDLEKKKAFLEKALTIDEETYGPEHYEVSRVLALLGVCYGNLGDYDKKKEVLERAAIIREKHHGPDHFELARILILLADDKISGPEKKKELLEKALTIQENSLGPEHHELAPTLLNLVVTYRDSGDMVKARKLFQRLKMLRRKWPKLTIWQRLQNKRIL